MTHDHDGGLAADLPKLINRRRALMLLTGGAASAALAACGSSSSPKAATGTIPEETAGPFPGDGSNGPNALAQSGVVRSDITKSFGDASGAAEGVPATVEMTLTRDGKVAFTTIFPGAYAGRWPHIHFEVYESLDAATNAGSKLRTSQLAIPQDACDAVYATAGYEQSKQNLGQTSLDRDMVFSDGYDSQLASASGNPDSGMSLQLDVSV